LLKSLNEEFDLWTESRVSFKEVAHYEEWYVALSNVRHSVLKARQHYIADQGVFGELLKKWEELSKGTLNPKTLNPEP